MEIRQVPHAAVKPYTARASKERVSLADAQHKTWFACFEGDTMLGFGFVSVRGGRARLGGMYVLPEHRGRGVGSAITDHRIQRALAQDVSCIECISVAPAWWEARGFKVTRRLPDGRAWLAKAV